MDKSKFILMVKRHVKRVHHHTKKALSAIKSTHDAFYSVWLHPVRIIKGSLFYFLSIFIIPLFLVEGYVVKTIKWGQKRMPGLPEWEEKTFLFTSYWELIKEGFYMTGVLFFWAIPFVVLAAIWIWAYYATGIWIFKPTVYFLFSPVTIAYYFFLHCHALS